MFFFFVEPSVLAYRAETYSDVTAWFFPSLAWVSVLLGRALLGELYFRRAKFYMGVSLTGPCIARKTLFLQCQVVLGYLAYWVEYCSEGLCFRRAKFWLGFWLPRQSNARFLQSQVLLGFLDSWTEHCLDFCRAKLCLLGFLASWVEHCSIFCRDKLCLGFCLLGPSIAWILQSQALVGFLAS